MQDTLKLVRGAVSNIDLIPVLTHFFIDGPRIQGSNGRIVIDAWGPDTGITALVPADRFIKAIGDANTNLTFVLNESKLIIKKGRLRVTINTLPIDSFPVTDDFDGEEVKFDKNILRDLKRLVPFISNDASRPWSNSVLVRDGYAYATNNVLLARVPFYTDRELIIPSHLVTELLRIDQIPDAIHVTEHAVSVLYDTFRLRGQQVMGEWPLQLVALVERIAASSPPLLPEGLLQAVEDLKPFFPDPKMPIVEFGQEGVSTQEGIHCAIVEQAGLPESKYRYESLITMLNVATHADFHAYPDPIPFKGDKIEGLLSGLRN